MTLASTALSVNDFSVAHSSFLVPPYTAQALAFLDAMFGHKAPELYLTISHHPTKTTQFFQDHQAAVPYIDGIKHKYNVYFSCGLQRSQPAQGRGTAKDIHAITSWWVDIDVATIGAHSTPKTLPPDLAAVLAFLERFKVPASIVIDSGHGVHAYWLMRELMAPMQHVQRFQQYLRTLFQANGWALDYTHDPSRLLRVPGTTNFKGAPLPVSILQWHPERCCVLKDFSWLPELPRQERANGGTVRLPAHLPPVPKVKFWALYENNLRFYAVWEKEATLPNGNPSDNNPWDLAIATYAAQAEWTDEEIASLIIYYRTVKHNVGFKTKTNLAYYLGRTIGKARANAAKTHERDRHDGRV
jgi:hypothetical protein